MVEVTTLDGTRHLWGRGDADARNVPQGISFRTKRADGFADGSVTLSRRIDHDYPDVELISSVAFIGAPGDTAYEGRVHAIPRSLGTTHSVSVQLASWMSYLKNHKAVEVFVDRDFGKWGEPSLVRRANEAGAGHDMSMISSSSSRDGLVWDLPNSALPTGANNELFYAAPPGVNVGKIMYKGNRTTPPASVEGPTIYAGTSDTLGSTISHALTLDDTLRTQVLSAARRYLMLRAYMSTGATPSAGSQIRYSQIAVYGDHGLSTHAISGEPDGVYASDIVRYVVGKWGPKINTSGVQNTSYPIGHLVFSDRTFPYDMLLAANRPHRWGLEVWDNQTLHFGPVDMTDYDWEVRLSDPGVTFDPMGDTVQELANGIAVTYTDVATNQTNTVTPDDDTSLADTNPDNPANLAGEKYWQELTLSWPSSRGDAIQIGRAALAEFNRPKASGRVSLQGHVRDRGGNWQPVWKMRAGQRLVITDFPNDSIRLIQETDYNHDSYRIGVDVENPTQRVDALFDRITDALAANGLT